jgi:DNA polymerase-3 subunit chi
MTEISFYRLGSRSSLRTLAELLEKTVESGARALVVVGSEKRATYVSQYIWAFREDAFIPHGMASDAPSEHPVLISTAPRNLNGATTLFLVDGGSLPPDVGRYERIIYLFDAELPMLPADARDLWDNARRDMVAEAREHWESARQRGFGRSFWEPDDNGAWQKVA